MKTLKFIAILVAVLPALTWAKLKLESPQNLLAKAQQNRVGLREVVMDIEMNIPELRDQPTFEKYFFLMDDLTQLAVKHNLDAYYPGIVKNLGISLASNGMRWLDVTKDTPTKLQYYIKWMNVETLGRFLSLVDYQLGEIHDRARLQKMAENVETLLPLIDKQAENQLYIRLGFREVMTNAAIGILEDKNLPAADVQFWIGKIHVASALSTYLEVLNQSIYVMTPETKELGHEYLRRLMLVNQQLGKLTDTTPVWLTAAVRGAVAEFLVRAIRLELRMSPAQFEEAVQTLGVSQTLGLIQQLMSSDKTPSETYVNNYLTYMNILTLRAEALGLTKEADEFQTWLSRSAAPVMASKLDIEGHYEVTGEKGDKWFFTIAAAKERTLIAALGSADGLVYKSFYNITYSTNGSGFVASQRDPDLDHEQNPPVKFSVNAKGEITILDIFVRVGSRTLKGHKVQNFTDMWKTAPKITTSADGVYEGTLFLPNGKEIKARVMITTFNGYTLGRLDAETMTVDFNIGSRGKDGVVILTSGRKEGNSWIQLRANVTTEGLKAYLIIGGKGQGIACTNLKRVDDN